MSWYWDCTKSTFLLLIDMVATSHGVIWRDNPGQIIEKYLEWADGYSEDRIVIIYDTMWDGTRRMAESIAGGIREADDEVTVKLFNAAKSDRNDMITEVFRSKAVLAGSPTIGKGITSGMAGLLEEIEGLRFRGKKAAAFGCYGWSGEAVAKMSKWLERAGFSLMNDGIKCLWNPDDEAFARCRSFGRNIAEGS